MSYNHQEKAINESWEALLAKEARCKAELREINKHLDLAKDLHDQVDEIFHDIINSIERFETSTGDDRSAYFDKTAHRKAMLDNEEGYQESMADLEAEKYRLEEERSYIYYQKEQFWKKQREEKGI
ncbi:hypothetical protein [Streptococcus oricebi]|uniref:Cingulin n=1 Tax=Streptococcus oricebi TaxID=1547447 RepID=A0ABS5B0U6_9STRE|nr:hypothetical protein [Streptococcus oricebi]MBP2622454.1 hypothetical protein [Streptococcus oricebi]